MYKSFQKQIKELKEKDRIHEEKQKKLEEEIEKLKTQNTPELEDINNKLSSYAQHAIDSSKGPLKPEELSKLLMCDIDKRNKEVLTLIRSYSNNVDGIKKQLSQISENLQIHIAYRKKQKELDDKLIKRLKNLGKTIEKQEEKEIKSGTKLMMQSTLNQCIGWGNVSCKVEFHCNKVQNSSTHEVEQASTSKQGMSVKEGKYSRKRKRADDDSSSSQESGVKHITSGKQGMPIKEGKPSRKRKRVDDDSSSSQESGVKYITSRFSKRLKINSSKSTTESSSSTEFTSVQETDDLTEPVSVVSTESNQSSTQPVDSSQSDAMSVDDSAEKIDKMKTAKKVTGKMSKQTDENAPTYNGEAETVHERRFYLRGKPL